MTRLAEKNNCKISSSNFTRRVWSKIKTSYGKQHVDQEENTSSNGKSTYKTTNMTTTK